MLQNYLYLFGLVILVAGLQGWLAGSTVSIIAAGVLGGCVLAGGYLLGTTGLVLALIGAVGIAGRFFPAYLKAKDKVKALWPAGVLAVMALVAIVFVAKSLF